MARGKPHTDLSAEYVRSTFTLENGELRWKFRVNPPNTRGGRIAGYVHSNGYRYVVINHRWYLVHRIIFLHQNGHWPPAVIDHQFHNVLDNGSIRPADRSQNCFNRRKDRRNTSGYKGVSFVRHSKRWRAQIAAYRKNYNLGVFDTKQEAYAAYCAAAKRLHGEFACVD